MRTELFYLDTTEIIQYFDEFQQWVQKIIGKYLHNQISDNGFCNKCFYILIYLIED